MGVSVRQKTKDGPWYVFIRHNNKRTSKQVGDKRDATRIAREVRAAIAAGDLRLFEAPTPTGPTFADFAEEFLKRSAVDLKHSTLTDYRSVVKQRLAPILGPYDLKEIGRREVRNLEARLRSDELSEINIRKHIRVLSSILSAAVEDDLIESNPVLGRGRGRHRSKQRSGTTHRRLDPFTAEELTTLLTTCRTHLHAKGGAPVFVRHFPFLLTLARAGLRLGEAVALRWGDIDWPDGTMLIQRSITRGVVDVPKGGKFRRVDMTDELKRTLRAELAVRFGRVTQMDAEAEAVKQGAALDSIVFPDSSGGMMDAENFRSRVWYPLLVASGLRRRRLHDMRHSYASILLGDGAELLYVSKQLGHHSPSFTLDVYGHLMPQNRRHVANRLDSLAPSGTPTAPDEVGDEDDGGWNEQNPLISQGVLSGPRVTRTLDPLIKSQLL